MNDHATAFRYYKEAYILSSNINYPLGMIVALNNSVDVLLFLQNYRLAYNAIGQVYKFFEATQNAYGIGMALSKFGHLYFTQGDLYYPLSEKYFRLAIDVKVKNNFFKETLDDWVFLYEIFKSRKDLPSAEICLTQGLNIIRTYEIDKEEGRFYKLLGDLYLMKNKIEEALD
jgi:tetratricopeptide (TPR) repeat protein